MQIADCIVRLDSDPGLNLYGKMKKSGKVKWNKDSTLELLCAMKKFEEGNRGPGLARVNQWTRRLNRWQTIASMMTNPPDIELEKFARSCSMLFTKVCSMYRRGLEGTRRKVLEDEVQNKLQEYFELFPPGRFKHTGRFDETPGSPVMKHGRRQKRKFPTGDEEESGKSRTTSDKSSISGGPSYERLRSGSDSGRDEGDADEVDGHISAKGDIVVKCPTQEREHTDGKCQTQEREDIVDKCHSEEREDIVVKCPTQEREDIAVKCPTQEREDVVVKCPTQEREDIVGKCQTQEREDVVDKCQSQEREDVNTCHSQAREDIVVMCQTQERLDTARKMESVLLWLKHWVTRNILPITDALRRPALNPKRRRKVIDRCWKMEVEQLDRYLGGVLAEHPEYLVDTTNKYVIDECKPLRHQITVELNKIGEEMNKIRQVYDKCLKLPQDDCQPRNFKST